MRKSYFLLITIFFVRLVTAAQIVWNGPAITFTKAPFADFTITANQDRITDSVWITRADSKGLFNIKSETAYTGNSPYNTLCEI